MMSLDASTVTSALILADLQQYCPSLDFGTQPALSLASDCKWPACWSTPSTPTRLVARPAWSAKGNRRDCRLRGCGRGSLRELEGRPARQRMLLTALTGRDGTKAPACQVPRAGQLHQLGQKLPCGNVDRESTFDCTPINFEHCKHQTW